MSGACFVGSHGNVSIKLGRCRPTLQTKALPNTYCMAVDRPWSKPTSSRASLALPLLSWAADVRAWPEAVPPLTCIAQHDAVFMAHGAAADFVCPRVLNVIWPNQTETPPLS